ncbi:hypothetical protein ACJ72_05897 [Emergomyces africanus]|uniref:Uncharacterized protein n=1 Tax=Emergomyces africanus TaxID=1955775 RepID=A0A1B7NT11_9EURO|nr:hypothetical protein ACJ72_05897 [Emergomyces africanus]
MSPALITEQAEHGNEIIALARGFDTLIETIQKLTWQERDLWNKLQFAHDEYLKLANQLPSLSPAQTEIAEKISPVPFQKTNCDISVDHTGWIYDVEKAGYITAPELEVIARGLEAYRVLADKRVTRDGYHHQNGNTCLVAVDAKARSSIERDFTVKGVQGNLRCPFAISNGKGASPKLANINPDACAQDLDPIKAESLQGTRSASVQDAAPRCPIRYLDDHSPEEVAKYVENHKHEIPRSHAICIQRYQKDSQSVRQLDEKYGDMVNMIKGLGLYHQPYLPSTQDPGKQGDTGSVSVGRVEKWAEDVSAKSREIDIMPVSHQGEDNGELEEEDGRQSHFNRPLRDVRVGESPSRPWGIHVPISHQVAQSPMVSPTAPVVRDGGTRVANYDKDTLERSSVLNSMPEKPNPSPAAGRCPFQARMDKDDPPATVLPRAAAADIQSEENSRRHRLDNLPPPLNPSESDTPPLSPVQPKMVFHGPVFFGYSAEDAAALLQQLSHTSGLK